MRAAIEGFRLSPQQRRLWLLQQGSSAYWAQCAISIQGKVDATLLRRSVETVVARHEALRTSFHGRPGMKTPLQVISSDAPMPWRMLDLNGGRHPEREADIDRIMEEERRFDFEQPPFVRAALISISRVTHTLLLSASSLCADAKSFCNLVREIAGSYPARLRSEDDVDGPVQYLQFSEWQNGLIEDDGGGAGREYWKEYTRGTSCSLVLPLESGHGEKTDYDPRCVESEINPAHAYRIKIVARKYDCSIDAVLFACWQTLLWRLCGENELTTAFVSDGRKYEELKGAVGLFAKWLPVRSRFDSRMTFADILSRAENAIRQALRFQEYFVLENEELTETPAAEFPIGFEFVELPATGACNGISFSLDKHYVFTDRFKMRLTCIESGKSVGARIDYDPTLLDAEDVARLLQQYLSLVEGAVANPESRIAQISLLNASQKEELLNQSRGTGGGYSIDQSVHRMIEQEAENSPEAVAVSFEEKEITYRELNERANRVGRYLKQRGVGPETVVMILMERGIEIVEAILGVMKAGGAYLPLDPRQPEGRIRIMIEDSGAVALIVEDEVEEWVRQAGIEIVSLRRDQEKIGECGKENPEGEVEGKNLIYILYTSGSTGRPKAVEIEHRQMVNYIRGVRERLRMGEVRRYGMVSTFGADLGNTVFYGSLGSGGRLEIVSQERAWEGEKLGQYLRSRGVECLKIVPSHLKAVLEGGERIGLKKLILGGEASRWEMVEEIKRREEGAEIYNHYGPTETTVGVLTEEVRGEERDGRIGTAPIGKALPGSWVYVLDEEKELTPRWVGGEIYIGGAGVGRGYRGEAEMTAEKFLPDPYGEAGGRMYRTGDKGRYVPGGRIEYLGRVDEQLKVRGYRIEPGEIEAVLRKQAGVRESVVIGKGVEGEEKKLVAYVVGDQQEIGSASELRKKLRESLPEYMAPSAIVMLKSLPLTSNGKIDKKALPEPDAADNGRDSVFVPARYGLEFQLIQIWEDILDVRPIGIKDNFFDLGGHSLVGIRVMAQIQKLFGKTLPLSILFEAQTIEKLAVEVREHVGILSRSPLVRIQGGAARPPFFCVHPVGGTVMCYIELARHLGSDRPFYALHAPDSDRPLTRLEDIAAEYVEAMMTVQPEGPYLLGGWSFGAIAAFEMAQQLQRNGRQVALLVLIDRRGPLLDNEVAPHGSGDDEIFYDPSEVEDPIVLARIANHMAGQFGEYLPISFDYLRQLEVSEQYNYILDHAKKRNLVPQEFQVEQMLRLLKGYLGRREAARKYEAKLYPGGITLLRASEVKPNLLELSAADPSLGWQRFSARPVEIHTIPGSHATIISEPNVQFLASQLRLCIASAEKG